MKNFSYTVILRTLYIKSHISRLTKRFEIFLNCFDLGI